MRGWLGLSEIRWRESQLHVESKTARTRNQCGAQHLFTGALETHTHIPLCMCSHLPLDIGTHSDRHSLRSALTQIGTHSDRHSLRSALTQIGTHSDRHSLRSALTQIGTHSESSPHRQIHRHRIGYLTDHSLLDQMITQQQTVNASHARQLSMGPRRGRQSTQQRQQLP